MDNKVLYYGREAYVCSFFDSDCLKFKKSEGKPCFDDNAIHEYKDFPDEYIVYLDSLSIEDRLNIQYLDENEAQKCFCKRLGRSDSPYKMSKNGIIEIIGDDPLDYEALPDFVDPGKFAIVKCSKCGCNYRVNMKSGYRTSYFNWVQA